MRAAISSLWRELAELRTRKWERDAQHGGMDRGPMRR